MKFVKAFKLSHCFSPSSTHYKHEDDQKLKQITHHNAHAFTYKELKFATDRFSSSNKIGEGGFGSVYKGRLKDGRSVAVKVLSVESSQGDTEFISEIASLCNISHENLVKLYGGCVHGVQRLLVYEYMLNNSLSETVFGKEKRMDFISWEIRKQICVGIARGLAYIHEEINPHVVHRDIKASNILLDHKFNPKIADFGLSKLFPDQITHISTRVAGTLGYLAPEYAITGKLSRKSDVYSFGALLLQIISGKPIRIVDSLGQEHYLVEKAWEMYNEDKLPKFVDPKLTGDNLFNEGEAVRILKVGLLCVQERSGLRPIMTKALKLMLLEGGNNVDNLSISRPGYINNINDVKVKQVEEEEPPSAGYMNFMCSPQFYNF
ncbi:unnamed protein product [Rhodiola kirilowii]